MATTQIELLEKLFDAKLSPIHEDIVEIKQAIYGNGKPGIINRLNAVEYNQKGIMAKFAMFTVFFGMVFTAIWEIGKEFLQQNFNK